jgi:heme/copper-type cytochrome/quinol oxidase subunit 2
MEAVETIISSMMTIILSILGGIFALGFICELLIRQSSNTANQHSAFLKRTEPPHPQKKQKNHYMWNISQL